MGKPAVIIRRQASPLTPEVHRIVMQLLKDIRYGSISLVVQDGVVLQVNATEKIRIEQPTSAVSAAWMSESA